MTSKTTTMTAAGRTTAGEETRRKILEAGVRLASVQGLSSMSLSMLAAAVEMSKSGLFAHFQSKDILLVAVVDLAERMFEERVIRPALDRPPGIERLDRLLAGFVEECAGVFGDGRSFLATVVQEFEGRPGIVRDRIQAFVHRYKDLVMTSLEEAKAAGHMTHDVEPDRFVFAVIGFGLATTWHGHLYGDPELGRKLGHEQMRVLLRARWTPEGERLLRDR